jgi:uncharacterized membrane protein
MTWVRLSHWVFGIVFAGFLAWYLAVQVVMRIHGYVTQEPPPHWDHSAFWMLVHIVGGIVVLAIGPIQFFPPFRDRFPRVHRALGRVYIAMSLLSIIGLLARVIPVTDFATRPSLYVVTILWLLSIVAAYLSIRIGDWVAHMSFMMRGYVFASYFLLVRFVLPWFEDAINPKEPEAFWLLATDFLAWMIPWIVLEIGLFVWRFNRVRKGELDLAPELN